MIFVELFFTFLRIGLFTFGGGLGMVALIQDEVVVRKGWMTAAEFTDIIAVSEMTPGPVGINTATYAGYTAVLHAGYEPWMAVLGSLLASVAVILLPATLMVIVLRFLQRHGYNTIIQQVLLLLRVVVIGVIASAALMLVGESSFGRVGMNRQFIVSILLFVAVFALSVIPRTKGLPLFGGALTLRRPSPIALIIASGLIGAVVYGGM